MDTSFTTTSSDALKLSDMVAELKSTGDTSMKMDLQLESSVHQRKSIRPLLSKSNASLEVNPDWGKRYVHAQARLYILIDSIDGPLLRSELVIRVLSQLAACSSVSLIAASDTLNASMLWSPLQLAHFRWTYMHTPIWEPYPRRKDSGTPDASDNPNAVGEVDPDSMNDLIENNTGVKDAMGLDAILAALTESSKELLRQMMKLCTPVNTVTSTSTSTSTGSSRDPKQLTSSILKSTLLEVCKKNLILRSGVELDNQLTELVDQRIVRIDREKGRRDLDMIVCLVPLAILTAKLS